MPETRFSKVIVKLPAATYKIYTDIIASHTFIVFEYLNYCLNFSKTTEMSIFRSLTAA